MTWSPRTEIDPNAVEFQFYAAFRRSAHSGSGRDGFPLTGDVFTDELSVNGGRIRFGDGSDSGDSMQFVAIAHDVENDWVVGRAVSEDTGNGILHVYDQSTFYIASVSDCCRLQECSTAHPDQPVTNAHINNGDRWEEFRLETVVNPGMANSSPVSNLTPIVNCPVEGVCQFRIPASDNEGEVSFRLGTHDEGEIDVQPGAANNCTGGLATIDPETGVYTWDTRGCDRAADVDCATADSTLYSTHVVVEDADGASTPLDFFIRLFDDCEAGDTPPTFDEGSPCGEVLVAGPGDAVNFTVRTVDPDSGDQSVLQAGGLAAGATAAPGLPVEGNPVATSVSWTPGEEHIGQHVMTFIATEECGAQTLCSVTVDVNLENCSNGPDDDGDGLADCDDPDCDFDPACGICGNGVLEYGEDCDDGNTVDGDCCDSDCSFEVAETACADDGNPCTDDVCDGAGVCSHPGNTASCDDGLFCTEGDTCMDGVCEAGAPRDCSYLNSECGVATCSEEAGACVATGASNGTPCDDGLFCTVSDACQDGFCVGEGDPCSGGSMCNATCNEEAGGFNCFDPAESPCAADSDLCTDDVCDGAGNCTHPFNTVPCEDGDPCTAGDSCSSGVCVGGDAPACDDGNQCTVDTCDSSVGCSHSEVDFIAACNWTVMGSDASSKRVKTLIGDRTSIAGDVCLEFAQLRTEVQVSGDVVVTDPRHKKSLAIAHGVQVFGDVVTGGGAISGRPSKQHLPGLTKVKRIPGGQAVDGAEGEHYDTTGTSERIADCTRDSATLIGATANLNAMVATASMGSHKVAPGAELLIAPGFTPGVQTGVRNVVDFDFFRSMPDSALILDGGGDSETQYILRFGRELRMKLRSRIVLQNGLRPENVLLYSPGKKACRIGDEVIGNGVIFCNGKLQVRRAVQWNGGFISPRLVELWGQIQATHAPFLGNF